MAINNLSGIDAAEVYVSLPHPVRVIPIPPEEKYPKGLDNWGQIAAEDLKGVRELWSGSRKNHGVSIVTGPGSDVWVLDVDVGPGKSGAASFKKLEADNGPLPPTWIARTGGGGLHLFFQWDEDYPLNNGHATHLDAGLDIRGDGGQVVAAPSLHASGNKYQWIEGRAPNDVELAAAPHWLYAILFPPEVVLGPGVDVSDLAVADPSNAEDSIVDWMRARLDWVSLLEEAGWALTQQKGDESHWARPGKSKGTSLVLHESEGVAVLFTWEITPAMAKLGTPTRDSSGLSLSAFDFWAATKFNGSRSDAARFARQERTRLEGPSLKAKAVEQGDSPQGLISLAPIWNEQPDLKVPDLAPMANGVGLLYVDELNWIHGESGSGKTWVLLYALAEYVLGGGRVLWVHYEDPTPFTIIKRLKQLGLDAAAADRFFYWNPAGDPPDWERIYEVCVEHGIRHVALDSVGEALNACGVSENADDEVGPWITSGPRLFVNNGIGFTGVDHSTKSREMNLYPSGTKRKRAAVTGLGLLIEVGSAPTQTEDGWFRVICAKDRHGAHKQGDAIAHLHIQHDMTGEADRWRLTEPPPEPVEADTQPRGGDHAAGDPEANERLMEIYQLVSDAGSLNKTDLVDAMAAARRTKKMAWIDLAVERKVVVWSPGPGKSNIYSVE